MTSAAAARSGRDGMLVVPVQDWRPMTMPVHVRADVLRSTSFPLAGADEVVEVVVR